MIKQKQLWTAATLLEEMEEFFNELYRAGVGLESESRVAYMGYLSSLRSRWLDIGQVLVIFLRACGPRRSRGPWTRK